MLPVPVAHCGCVVRRIPESNPVAPVDHLPFTHGSSRSNHSRLSVTSWKETVMTTAEKHELPMARTCPFAPPPVYQEVREEEPVSRVRLPDGGWAWMASRHEDVRTVLNDRRFSADRQQPDFPHLVKGEAASRRPDEERTLLAMDAAEHKPARKAVLGEFTARRLEALRRRIQEIVDERIEALLAGPQPGDLVNSLSLPVPSRVIRELLGVPCADHEFFQEHT